MTKKLIGHVAVDSGQLMLCDPCYIDSEWAREEFDDVRIYKSKVTGDTLEFRKDFAAYNLPIPSQGGYSMNDLLETDEWEQVPNATAQHNFSYNACCKATLSEGGHGQLNFNMGHPGVGVAFSTAFGDGTYPVYAQYDNEGILISVSVSFSEIEEMP